MTKMTTTKKVRLKIIEISKQSEHEWDVPFVEDKQYIHYGKKLCKRFFGAEGEGEGYAGVYNYAIKGTVHKAKYKDVVCEDGMPGYWQYYAFLIEDFEEVDLLNFMDKQYSVEDIMIATENFEAVDCPKCKKTWHYIEARIEKETKC